MPATYAFMQSWFEPGETVAAVIGGGRTRNLREEAVLRTILPARRARWADRLARTAKPVQDETEGDAAIDFALVARELLGNRPLTEIPVAQWIAENTLAALSGGLGPRPRARLIETRQERREPCLTFRPTAP